MILGIIVLVGFYLIYPFEKNITGNAIITDSIKSDLSLKDPVDNEASKQYDRLPAEIKEQTDYDTVKEAILTKNILIEKASEKEITVGTDEVDEFIDRSKAQFAISDEDFNDKLVEFGISEDEYKAEIKEQIMIAKLINQSIDPEDYKVTDEEVDQFFEDNKEDYEDIDDNIMIFMREKIKSQMEIEKKQELVANFIEKIKKEG